MDVTCVRVMTPQQVRERWQAYLEAIQPIVALRVQLRDAYLPRISVDLAEGPTGVEVVWPDEMLEKDAELERWQGWLLDRCMGRSVDVTSNLKEG